MREARLALVCGLVVVVASLTVGWAITAAAIVGFCLGAACGAYAAERG